MNNCVRASSSLVLGTRNRVRRKFDAVLLFACPRPAIPPPPAPDATQPQRRQRRPPPRLREGFDDITSDFSTLSKELFEAYAGVKVAAFPEDILRWEQDAEGKWSWSEGPLFRRWIEWRASVIKEFVVEARRQLKEINPDLLVGDYTGAWYPTYYYVGVNWASEKFDPAQYFDWATPEYYKTGYAEELDIYMTGLYYTLVTKAEVDAANGVVGQRTEAGMTDDQSYWYCIEGGAEWARRITAGVVPVTGSLYVDQYGDDAERFTRAVAEALRGTDGLMIFDIVHIIDRDWWSVLAEGIAEGGKQPEPTLQ